MPLVQYQILVLLFADIYKPFPDKPVNNSKQESQETKKGLKFSYRVYVNGVHITSNFFLITT